MIAMLRGTLEMRDEDAVVIDVNGVGFYVHVPTPVLRELGHEGSTVSLYTYLHVRENELSLYGFNTPEQRALFRKLIGVPGVGPKAALALLSLLEPERLQEAIAEGDVSLLTQAPGIGRRTAERLILDLKGKIDLKRVGAPAPTLTDAEVIAALQSLGYTLAEAQEALRHLPDEEMSLEEKVAAALRYFAG
jgi:Holliday junction DNA helicase RuvA